MKDASILVLLTSLLGISSCVESFHVTKAKTVAAISLCNSAANPTSNGFQSGSGILGDPYTICTAVQLNSIGDNFLDKHFLVLQNIDLSSIPNFTVIGSGPLFMDDLFYSGTFDGGGYTISNLTQTIVTRNYYGMFGYVTNAGKLINTHLSSVTIDDAASPGGIMGALAGYTEGEISNSSSSGVLLGTSLAGGLIGSAENGAMISNSFSSATVNGFRAGGLVGFLYESSIEDSHATGAVTSERYTGGLIGSAESFLTVVNIENCYASGNVVGTVGGYDTGGLIGNVTTDALNLNLSKSYATGSVSGDNNVGGLVGTMGAWGGGTVLVSDSYSIGNVYAENGFAGGLAGGMYDTSVSNSYSIGIVTGGVGAPNLGGVVGDSWTAVFSNIYWNIAAQADADASAPGVVAGVTSLTIPNMKTSGNFTGFDFINIWTISPTVNNGHPTLR